MSPNLQTDGQVLRWRQRARMDPYRLGPPGSYTHDPFRPLHDGYRGPPPHDIPRAPSFRIVHLMP